MSQFNVKLSFLSAPCKDFACVKMCLLQVEHRGQERISCKKQ